MAPLPLTALVAVLFTGITLPLVLNLGLG